MILILTVLFVTNLFRGFVQPMWKSHFLAIQFVDISIFHIWWMTGAVETVDICKDWISSHDYFHIERNLSYAESERSLFKNEHVRFLSKQNPRYINIYKYRIMHGLEWGTVYALSRVLFSCLFPDFRSTSEVNANITREWEHWEYLCVRPTIIGVLPKSQWHETMQSLGNFPSRDVWYEFTSLSVRWNCGKWWENTPMNIVWNIIM